MAKAKEQDMANSVMERLAAEEVQMRPKWQFVLGSYLSGLGLVVLLLAAAVMVNLMLRQIRLFGPVGYLEFGALGVEAFLLSFPFGFLVFAVLSVVAGWWLMQRYDFSYRTDWKLLLVAVLGVILTVGFVVDWSGVNEQLHDRAWADPVYLDYEEDQRFYMGRVVNVGRGRITIVTFDSRKVPAEWTEETMFPDGREFEVEQVVRVVGEWRESVFEVSGVAEGGF